MANVEITAQPWAQLWRNANPSMRSFFLQDQEELYGNCPCRGPVNLYDEAAPDLCKCATGQSIDGGPGGRAPVTLAGVPGGLIPGALGLVPSWVLWLALAVAGGYVVARIVRR